MVQPGPPEIPPGSPHPTLGADPRWQLVERVVASSGFAKSALLSRFLHYICERALSGKTEEISEVQIGVHVFGRRPGYSRDEDNIVRNYARQLRQRIDHFYTAEGKGESLRLRIPRGQYIPEFVTNTPAEEALQGAMLVRQSAIPLASEVPTDEAGAETVAEMTRTALPGLGRSVLIWTGLVALLLCWIVAGSAITRFLRAYADPAYPLWTQLFDGRRPTLVVPADDGIVMFQNLTQHSVSLAEYINRDYLAVPSPFHIDQRNMADLEAQRYTSIADLDTVLRISALPEAEPGRVAVRYARELHMEDLKDANAVLLGSVFSNPWVELFEKNLNFVFQYQPHPNESVIVNRHPRTGELPVYVNDAAGTTHRTYALIALVPNLDNTGWVLLVEGLTMAGTQAASDTLFHAAPLRPILDKARAEHGGLEPFEVLIETSSFGSNAPQARIIASRIYSRFPAS